MRILSLLILSPLLMTNVCPSGAGVTILNSQPTSCRTYDEYGALSFENEIPRLDEYAKQLEKEPEAAAIIFIYPDSRQTYKKAQSRAKRLMDYLVNKRGVTPKRIGAITMKEVRPEFKAQLLICPFFRPSELRRMYDGKVIVGTEIKKMHTKVITRPRLTTHSTGARIALLSCARLGRNQVVCCPVNSGVRLLLNGEE